MNNPIETVCCGCGTDDQHATRGEALGAGWVRARGTWTCPACVDEWRTEQQATYDASHPALYDVQAVER